MKPISVLLIPSIALLVSACASGPAGYGGGPGYDGNSTVYVQGQDYNRPDGDRYTSDRTNVNDVTVNRTNVNDTTVNRTNVNRTNVNQTDVKNQGKGRQTAATGSKGKTVRKSVENNANSQQADQPPPRS